MEKRQPLTYRLLRLRYELFGPRYATADMLGNLGNLGALYLENPGLRVPPGQMLQRFSQYVTVEDERFWVRGVASTLVRNDLDDVGRLQLFVSLWAIAARHSLANAANIEEHCPLLGPF